MNPRISKETLETVRQNRAQMAFREEKRAEPVIVKAYQKTPSVSGKGSGKTAAQGIRLKKMFLASPGKGNTDKNTDSDEADRDGFRNREICRYVWRSAFAALFLVSFFAALLAELTSLSSADDTKGAKTPSFETIAEIAKYIPGIGEQGIRKFYAELFVADAFIGNTDRHKCETRTMFLVNWS